jgi:hypothetical protein
MSEEFRHLALTDEQFRNIKSNCATTITAALWSRWKKTGPYSNVANPNIYYENNFDFACGKFFVRYDLDMGDNTVSFTLTVDMQSKNVASKPTEISMAMTIYYNDEIIEQEEKTMHVFDHIYSVLSRSMNAWTKMVVRVVEK